MANYTDIYNLKSSSNLRNRLAVALTQAAEDIRNEDATVQFHAERFLWATGILSDPTGPDREAERGMWMLVQNPTIQDAGDAATDADIQFVANSLVNFLAGVDEST